MSQNKAIKAQPFTLTPEQRKARRVPNKRAPYFRAAMKEPAVSGFLGKNNRARTRGRNFDVVQKTINPQTELAKLGVQSAVESKLIRLKSWVKRWKNATGNYLSRRDLQ